MVEKRVPFWKGLFSEAMLAWGGCQFELSVTWCNNLLPAVLPQGQDRYARVVASSLSALGELVGRSQSPRGEIGEGSSFFPFSGGCAEELSLLYNFCFQQIWLFDNVTLCFMARVKWTHVLRRHVFFCISKDLTSVPVPMSYPLDSSKGPQVWWCMLIRINATHPPPMWFAWKCWGNPSPTLTWDPWERTFAWWDWDFTNF